jgi:hypothetical protein
MALIAEEIVEEWLNRNGYFTIRGIKIGNDEIDILAIRPLSNGLHDCRHVEVQVSINPISYITKVPAAIRKATGVAPHNAKKRERGELLDGVREWVAAKFDQPRKSELKKRLCPGTWTRELVIGTIRHEDEAELLMQAGVMIHRLGNLVSGMVANETIVKAAAGADLLSLMLLRETGASSSRLAAKTPDRRITSPLTFSPQPLASSSPPNI